MLQVSERLGDFEILRLLGKGGMGEVYEARQFNPDRRVALKVLASWLANDEDALDRFMREASVPANLDHPGIVRIISTGKTPDGKAFYAMHLVRGISLSDMIKRGGAGGQSEAPTRSVDLGNTPSEATPPDTRHPPTPVSPMPALDSNPQLLADYRLDRFTTLARIGVQAARALAHAHQQGHLHRDIKPSNMMVDHHDQVYLVDFGLTRGLEPAASSTMPGVVVGTPWYMSPEQADGKQLDARSDIYSLGVTLYEMATGGLGPFTASRDNKHAVLAQVRAGQTLPLRTLAPGIPSGLEKIILKAMHLKPSKRYANIADMAKDLEAFLGVSSRHSPQPSGPDLATPRTRVPILVGVAAISLVGIISLAAAYFSRDREPVGPKGNGGVQPAPVQPKPDGQRAFPESLRDPKNINVKVPLVDKNGAPIWSEKFFGNGKYSPVSIPAAHFVLTSETMLILADPDRSNFEFSIELAQLYPDVDMGIFFGLRRREKDTSDPYRFFLIRWQNLPVENDKHGRITLGTASVVVPNAVRAIAVNNWMKTLPPSKATIPLAEWDAKRGWPELKVRVQDEGVTVNVPNRPPLWFGLAELKGVDPNHYQDFNVIGAVGAWSKNGVGLFKNASLTPMP